MIRRKMITFLAIFTIFIMASSLTASAAIGIDSVEGYEEKSFLGGMDIWLNQTLSSSQAPTQDGYINTGVTWQLIHAIIVPDNQNIEWILEEGVKLVYGFGGNAGEDVQRDSFLNYPSFSASAEGDVKTETGNTEFTGRDVDGITNIDANDR